MSFNEFRRLDTGEWRNALFLAMGGAFGSFTKTRAGWPVTLLVFRRVFGKGLSSFAVPFRAAKARETPPRLMCRFSLDDWAGTFLLAK